LAPGVQLTTTASLLAGVFAVSACGRHSSSSSDAAPSASVIGIGVAIGACDDVPVCERECAGGSADRCRRLAASYAFGQGVAQDEARGAALYERACDMKDGSACVFAGQMHEYAKGVPKDETLAEHFYERGCDLHWIGGCYNQAIMFENGRGVPVDRGRARALYAMACTSGAKQACDKARELQAPPSRYGESGAP
jgi:TPR repeat protein